MIDQNKVQNICEKYKIKYTLYPNNIYIETALNTWIVADEHTHFRLKHKNKGVCKHSLHMHNKKFIDVSDVIEYIHTHDTKTIFDRRHSNERRIDKLLQEISTSKIIHNKPIGIVNQQ